MNLSLEQSYAYCRGIARSRARNFYYSFVLLPRPEQNAMCAIYAFMRYCDDVSDEPGADASRARASMARWREELDDALKGKYSAHPVWPAFDDAVRNYKIPHQYFRDMIEGVSSDLTPRDFRTFEELYRYCYQVASVAGLCTIHILGFDSQEAPALAEKCGVAFQLTNILRDVREDAAQGRVYFPAEDLERFGVAASDVLEGRKTEGFVRLLRYEAGRAKAYYAESRRLIGLIHKRNRPSLWALIEIYRRLLERIERTDFDVLRQRVRLPAWEKSWIVLRALAGAGR